LFSPFIITSIGIKEKEQGWLTRNKDNVSEWSDMSDRGRLFHPTTSISVVQSGQHNFLIDIQE